MDELNVHFEGWTQSSVLVLVPRVPAGGRGNNRTQILTLSGLERLALFSYCSVMDQGLLPVSVTQLQSPCGRCQRTGGSAESPSVSAVRTSWQNGSGLCESSWKTRYFHSLLQMSVFKGPH